MKASLQLRVAQGITLTPQLQQSIRLLQLSTLELNNEIERILLENPMLERLDDIPVERSRSREPGETPPEAAARDEAPDSDAPAREGNDDEHTDWSNIAESADWGATREGGHRDDEDDSDSRNVQVAERSLADHLGEQLALSPLEARDRILVQLLIDSLNENGWLDATFEELLALLPEEAGFEEDDLAIALKYLQNFDPPGIGARSAQECLALQLQARAAQQDCPPEHALALAERNFAQLRRVLGCDEAALRRANELILTLDPHPGARFAPDETRYVIPDIIVRKRGARWQAQINEDAMPRLRVNQLYAGILRQNRGNEGAATLADRLQEARWLIRNIQQRFDTILRCAQAIVARQQKFFDYGDVAMRPLTLREIAEEIEMHESTVSRITSQKYLATPRGVFEMKYFFGSHVATEAGGEASSTAIRALIRQIVDAEDRKKPLSDAKIAELLGEQGIVVARRTVAKYRENLGIASVSQRKTL
ncbi:MAG: RNA polymerase factor sigma-54 [Rhodocyclaceae bacterium]|nr:RNA polymerase factor sigma-54 [Rhodocyclaceae bacterium]